MLDTLLTFNELRNDVSGLKFMLKPFLGGDRNPTLKKTTPETKYVSALWKTSKFNLQRLAGTFQRLVVLGRERLTTMLNIYYKGQEQVPGLSNLESVGVPSDLNSTDCYMTVLAEVVMCGLSHAHLLDLELGFSHSIISERL